MHEAGLGFQLIRKHQIWIRSSPPLAFFLFFPPPPLPSFFLWARGNGVLSYLYIFAGREDWQRLRSERMNISGSKAWAYLFLHPGTQPPCYHLTPSTTCIWPFYHISVCCLYTDDWLFTRNASTKVQNLEQPKGYATMDRNYVRWFVFSPWSPFRQSG